MQQLVNVKGRYLNGDLNQYTFLGTLNFNGKEFNGLFNDRRCPATVRGTLDDGIWDFIKKYRLDGEILSNALFKDNNFTDKHFSTSPFKKGISYYGRTLFPLKKEKGVVVAGLYNATFEGRETNSGKMLDDFVKKLALSEENPTIKYGLPMEVLEKGSNEWVPAKTIGQWAMKVITEDPYISKIGQRTEFSPTMVKTY
jgi:hypothetical protein